MKFRYIAAATFSLLQPAVQRSHPNHGKLASMPHAAKEIDCKVTHFYSIKEMFPYFIYINIVFQCCNTQKGVTFCILMQKKHETGCNNKDLL